MFMMFPVGVLASVVAWVYCEEKYNRDYEFIKDMKLEAYAFLNNARLRKKEFERHDLTQSMYIYKNSNATYDAVDLVSLYVWTLWKKLNLIKRDGDKYIATAKRSGWEQYITVESYNEWICERYNIIKK